ncbi:MAG TPA: hypothetical protein VG722_04605 [Tepidisphaeraceae bacterium]|nr:hypothetical protein [Tepidisphaeraceae bacterium]
MSNEDASKNPKAGAASQPRWIWWLSIAGVVFLLLVVAYWYGALALARHRLNHEVSAARARGEPVLVADFRQPDLSDNLNGAVWLAQAAKELPDSPAFDKFDMESHQPPYSPADVKALGQIAQACEHVLPLIRKAIRCEHANWHLSLVPSDERNWTNGFITAIEPQRKLCEYLEYAGIYNHAIGHDAKTIEIVRDILGQAHVVQLMNYGELSQLSVQAMYEDTADNLFPMAPSLQIAEHSDDLATGTASVSQIRELIAAWLTAMPNSDAVAAIQQDRAWLLSEYGIYGDAFAQCPRVLVFLYRPAIISTLAKGFANLAVQANAMTQTNFDAAVKKLPVTEKEANNTNAEKLSQNDPFNVLITEGDFAKPTSKYPEAFFIGKSLCRLAAVALAVRWYRVEHGAYPASLQDLVPKYLPNVPPDPFSSSGSPLEYIHSTKHATVRSVGSKIKGFPKWLSVSLSPVPFVTHGATTNRVDVSKGLH